MKDAHPKAKSNLSRAEMTAVSNLVKGECANFKHGRCLFVLGGTCPVLAGWRCCVSRAVLLGGHPDAGGLDYFVACVTPLADSRLEYVEGANAYRRIVGGSAVIETRRCECGQPMGRGKHCCDTCRRKRVAAKQRKWRSACRRKLAVSPL
jgi:hypothetical protein